MYNSINRFRLRMLTVAAIISTIAVQAQPPLLNSYPSARATVYLDFDGQDVEGTIWNQQGPIHANPAALSADDITEIFNRISEDYHPFNINITTDASVYDKAPLLQRVRIIFTSTSDWYGNSAGVSCVGSFSWGDDTPGWVFGNLLGNNPRYIASCASHEIGHTLGLQHQSIYDGNCGKITEYNGGAGTPENGWAPIMGIGYYKNCTVWQVGTSAADCDSLQSDLDVIAGTRNHFGFRKDDYGDDQTKASPIKTFGQSFSIKGMINHKRDKDAFSIVLDSRNELQLQVIPNAVIQKGYPDVNTKISILNANADTISSYDQQKLLYEGIDIILDSGIYYFIIEDRGNNNRPGYDKPVFYAMSGLLINAEHLKQFALHWPVQARPVLSDIQAGDNGVEFTVSATGNQQIVRAITNMYENIIKQ